MRGEKIVVIQTNFLRKDNQRVPDSNVYIYIYIAKSNMIKEGCVFSN